MSDTAARRRVRRQAAKCADADDRIPFRRPGLKPGEAKRRGRRVRMVADWDGRKVAIMRGLLREKFAPGSELAARLLATHPRALVEGNDWGDRFWGVCRGQGENWLGRLLEQVRDELVVGREGSV